MVLPNGAGRNAVDQRRNADFARPERFINAWSAREKAGQAYVGGVDAILAKLGQTGIGKFAHAALRGESVELPLGLGTFHFTGRGNSNVR